MIFIVFLNRKFCIVSRVLIPFVTGERILKISPELLNTHPKCNSQVLETMMKKKFYGVRFS